MIIFLKKIDNNKLNILEKYLIDNKNYLESNIRSKIGLY